MSASTHNQLVNDRVQFSSSISGSLQLRVDDDTVAACLSLSFKRFDRAGGVLTCEFRD